MIKKRILFVELFLICLSYPINAQQAKIYCRFRYQNRDFYGQVKDTIIFSLDQAPWYGGRKTHQSFPISKVKLLYPSKPHVIIGLAKSYQESWINLLAPKFVRWFIKPPSSAAATNENIILPPILDEVKVEGEMVIVIGKRLKNATEKEAESGIFGFTTGIDVVGTVTSFHKFTGEPVNFPEKVLATGLKICDRFAPYGPFLVSTKNWKNHLCTLSIKYLNNNKKTIFKFNTNSLIYSPAKIVSDLSRILTLSPGDVIFTGTPKAFLAHNGDLVQFKIDGLGQIKNQIVLFKDSKIKRKD